MKIYKITEAGIVFVSASVCMCAEFLRRLVLQNGDIWFWRLYLQDEIIASILSGKDTMALLPTGGGKSLCFQIPTLVMAAEREARGEVGGLCLVVTPLIALMKDQVENLYRRNIRAAAIYTGMSYDRQKVALDNCQFGPYRFLYVSPERLESEDFRKRLAELPVTMIAVDEAHCISQWGYDFRPSYLKIAEIRNHLHPHGSPLALSTECVLGKGVGGKGLPILALTATATPAVVDDIQDRLGFAEHNVFRSSFARKNLQYIVRYVEQRQKGEQLLHILRHVPGSAIVYVRNRKNCKDLSDWINAQMSKSMVNGQSSNGQCSDFYHAGLSAAEREAKQNAWKADATRIMVCTNAFGMGIDKPDVRLVIHYDIPSHLESYFQEAGRAGRDGKTAYAVLLYDDREDRMKCRKRVSDNYPEKDFIESVYHKTCDHLVVGAGSGLGHSWAIHMDELCATMHLPVLQTYSAMHILAQAGYIDWEDDQETNARVRINISRREIEGYSLSTEQREVLDHLMRNYPGIFTDLQYINLPLPLDPHGSSSLPPKPHSSSSLPPKPHSSSSLPPKPHGSPLALSTECVLGKGDGGKGLLASLAARGIITYIPRSVACRFTLLKERQTEILLPEWVYEKRRNHFVESLKHMIEYASETEFCRQQVLLSYFGEDDAPCCGTCDVCRSRKQ